jgi:SAM-dependent methyltransferase
MIEFVLVPLVIAGLAVNGLRLRGRVPPMLPGGTASAESGADGYAWVISSETAVADATLRSAAAYARSGHLSLLDLAPADLPATAARDLLRQVDPRPYQADQFAPGRSAGAAMLADPELLSRADAAGPAGRTGRSDGTGPADREPADLAALAGQIRPYAGASAAIAVAPGLRAGRDDLGRRRARLRANGAIVPIYLAFDVVPFALTVAALTVAWTWGLAAAAAYCLQPYLIFGRTPLRPRGLHVAALLRLVHDPWVWTRTMAGRWRSPADVRRDTELAEAAGYYRAALADGTGLFFEERRLTCPWCGTGPLTVLLRCGDLVMQKPGRFTLERCGHCGHVFQNPRLTPEGLGFYYRDAYDGLGAATAETVFLSATESYAARALMLKPFTAPKAWLDVGTGHAHFCAAAREIWPDTVFDGLDQGAAIGAAERRGWITTGHRGMFPELASELAGRYDVVSMHHYLEHTREPLAELDAAARVLPDGGYLLIELPDPQWRLARLFGRYWMAWFQPQHQHMMPIGNLTRALAERGMQPVATERGPAHQANDAVMAAYLFFARLAPDRSMPWSPRPPTPGARMWRGLVWTAGAPALITGLLMDRVLGRTLARHWDRGNAYRVLARKEEPADG